MKSFLCLSSLVLVSFLNGCATSAPATAVEVTVTGNSQVDKVLARDLRAATLSAIAKSAPNAAALQVAVILDEGTPGSTMLAPNSGAVQQRAIPSLSTHPEEDGAAPTVSVLPAQISGEIPMDAAALRGTYTISTGDGQVVESRSLDVARPLLRELLRDTSDFLASRVKALSH